MAKKALMAVVPKITKATTDTSVITQKPPNIELKEEYKKHLQTLGATGGGLAPEDVTPGSEMANLVASIRELPNYNLIAVTTSTPGVDHTGQAAALFEFAGHNDIEETPTASV
ncbi:hypothetical protein BYT27DRAFT_7258624 [Phlegmacium glaucopus]|nr:hypothetical protein BYT27DRAFT_7258624 [Phlegmacium glaucopus]